jgi:hypothetical protein
LQQVIVLAIAKKDRQRAIDGYANGNGERNWTIKPNGFRGSCGTADCSVKQNVARLNKMVTARGKTTAVNQGGFYLSFSIRVTHT